MQDLHRLWIDSRRSETEYRMHLEENSTHILLDTHQGQVQIITICFMFSGAASCSTVPIMALDADMDGFLVDDEAHPDSSLEFELEIRSSVHVARFASLI